MTHAVGTSAYPFDGVATRSSERTGAVIGASLAALALGVTAVLAYASTPADVHQNPYAGMQFLIGLSAASVGAFVAFRRPDHRLGWVLLAAGAASWLTFASSAVLPWMMLHWPTQETLGRAILHASIWGWIAARGCFVVLAPLVFPWARPRGAVARWTWWAGIAAVAATSIAHSRLWTFEYFAGQPATGTARFAESFLPWGHRAIWVLAVVALTSMVVGIVRSPAPDRRHLPVAGVLLLFAVPSLGSLGDQAFHLPAVAWFDGLELWTSAGLPIVLAAGIVREGLLDIEVVVRRATVFGVVIAVAVAAYVAVVSIVSLFVQEGAGIGPILATGLVAVGVLPVHAWVERVVARRLFGRRADPYGVIAMLGSRLALAPPGDEVLPLVTATLAEQLRVPFVAIELATGDGDGAVQAVQAGRAVSAVERFPLAFHGEHLGELVVGCRGEREPFRTAERDLLSAFARQAGVIAHNAALAHSLVESRAVLVAAREEERRRIRRDLHDGLGPTLATVSLSLAAAAERLGEDGELSALLRDLEGEIQGSIADIRRLVYDLRPPVLDDLGLVGALRGQAAHLAAHDAAGPVIEVALRPGPEADVDLPSAVELAAYRVALEAMTNVVRHAGARFCQVAIERDQQLTVRVEDDGVGIPGDVVRGVGLRSMRERVVELGGSLRVEARSPRGTSVRASFPLPVTVAAP